MLRKRIPFISQIEAAESGVAALAMVLSHHGHHAPLSEVRQACGISRDGSTAENLARAARGYGLLPNLRKIDSTAWTTCRGPAILQWETNHFVVLERCTPKRAYIVDPAVGRRVVPAKRADICFTGICLEMSVGETFVRRRAEHVSRSRYLRLLGAAGGTLAMVLIASLALNVLSIALPLTTQIVVDHVIGHGRVDWLTLVGASSIALITFSLLYSTLREWLTLRLRRHLGVTITSTFVAHLLDLPISFFSQRSSADLMSRVQSSQIIRNLLAGQSVSLLAGGVMLFAYLALMFAFDVQLSWIVLAASALYLIAYFAMKPILVAGNDATQRKSVTARSVLLQTLKGIATIKSAGVERASHQRWLGAWIDSLNANFRLSLRQQATSNLLLAAQTAVPILVLAFGGRRVLSGDLSLGRLVGFQMLQVGFLGPLQMIVSTLMSLHTIPVLLGRMDDVLLSPPEPVRVRKCPRLQGDIVLETVSFRYADTAPMVLSNISMRIEKGQKVALVGASGSGKSTLARLLLGLYTPTEGRILLDGHDLSTLDLASARRQYGVVLQETALFDGTIADNLRLFYPNAATEHIVQAARVAQIHDDILAMPQGYRTRVSSGAGPLSGGQRQRLALARAIVHRPTIMILDEATSALDAVTEAAIERYLATSACTRVVIAHRLSTVRDADVIFVLDGGCIVEQGRHDELLAAGGLYARLVSHGTSPAAPPEAPLRRQPVAPRDLAAFAAFGSWSDSDRADLARHLSRVELSPGSRIVEQDDRGAGLFLILSGEVAIELAEPGLAPWTVSTLGPGELFGEIGLLDGSPSSASVVAKTAVRLLHLPYARFHELLQRGEVLAIRTALALGAIVAERTRDAVGRYVEVASTKVSAGEPVSLSSRPRPRELPLSDTLLGASLSPSELEALERMGTRTVVHAGAELFTEGSPSDALLVLLAGRAGCRRRGTASLLRVAESGSMLGEASVFDPGPHAMSAVALEPSSVLSIDRDAMVELLLSGQTVARKLLSALADSLVRHFRAANHRLREVIALNNGEIERAHAAHERALEVASEERQVLFAPTRDRVPVVTVSDSESSVAACLTALIRALGRPVGLASVLDAFVPEGESVGALPIVARSFGLACRNVHIAFDDLRFIEGPILAMLKDRRAVIIERLRFRRWRLMDPLQGVYVIGDEALREQFTGAAFDIRADVFGATPTSFLQRIAAFAWAHRFAFGRLLLVTLLSQGIAMAMALATALAIQRVFPFGDRPLLWIVVAATAGLAVSLAVMQQLQTQATEHLRAHFDRDLLDQLVSHVLGLPIAFFDRFPPGEVLQRFQAFENVRLLLSSRIVTALPQVVSLFVCGTLMLAFDSRLAPIGFAAAGLYVLAAWMLFPSLRQAAADEVRARGTEQDRLLEILQGVVTLRMAGDRTVAHKRWFPAFMEQLLSVERRDRILGLSLPALDWLRGMALTASVWIGAREVLGGTKSVAALVAFLGVLAIFTGTAQSLLSQLLSVAPGLVDYGLVRATFREPREQTAHPLVSPGQLRGRVSVERVSFRYGSESAFVLKDISLEIESGMKVAIVGPSGSGKSTLGKLLLGMYLPTAGRVLFDGKDVVGLDLEALRRRVGVVLQDPFLLTGTIRENLTLGAGSAPIARVVEAAERAAIHSDIMKMPNNYSTLVSEGGTTFSGGQRQRCVLARVFLVGPAVMLLDEATSALDNINQANIERYLAESTATRIVIAHRLSTIVDSDLIVVLRKGEIVEKGTHQDLLAAGGPYADLVRAQL